MKMNKNVFVAFVGIVLVGGALVFFSDIDTGLINQAGQMGQKEAEEKSLAKTVNGVRYLDYTRGEFEKAVDKKRVYFFYAAWCPTCRPADAEFKKNLDKIPEDVVLFRTNYDTEDKLKKQYAVTYQHTFVLVDNAGNEVRKWNGGAVADLIANTR